MNTGICTFFSTMNSPIGSLLLTAHERALTGLYFSQGKKARLNADPEWCRDDDRFEQAKEQLQEYFSGRRQAFDLLLDPPATPFQARVLKALQRIPYGQTCTYKEIAETIGSPKAMRAVGNANGNNPLAIFIPCHRVVGSDGSLTGFGGGLDAKRFLLALER
jgi:methylated-DNA-[protein]-cysteine S-methyltransferase